MGHRDRQRAPLRLRGTRPGDRHGDELRSVGGLREIAAWKPVGVEPETHDQLRRGVKPLGPELLRRLDGRALEPEEWLGTIVEVDGHLDRAPGWPSRRQHALRHLVVAPRDRLRDRGRRKLEMRGERWTSTPHAYPRAGVGLAAAGRQESGRRED